MVARKKAVDSGVRNKSRLVSLLSSWTWFPLKQLDDIGKLQSKKAPLRPNSQVCLWEWKDPINKLRNCGWHNTSTAKCLVSCFFPLCDWFLLWWLSRREGVKKRGRLLRILKYLEYFLLLGILVLWIGRLVVRFFPLTFRSILGLYRFICCQNGSTWHTRSLSSTQPMFSGNQLFPRFPFYSLTHSFHE